MSWNDLFLPASLLVLLGWSVPGIIMPIYRFAARSQPVSRTTAYLLFCLVWSLSANTWTASGNVETALGSALAPLLPLLLIPSAASQTYLAPEVVVILTVGSVAGLAISLLLIGRFRIAAAVLLPILTISAAVLFQARISEAQMLAEFDRIGGTCVDRQTFFESLRAPWPYKFHAVARSGEKLFNWSYKSRSWEPIPSQDRPRYFEYAPTGRCALSAASNRP